MEQIVKAPPTRPENEDPIVFVPGFMASKLWRPRRNLLTPTVLVWPLTAYRLVTELLLLEEEYPLQPGGLVGRYYEGLINFVTAPVEIGGLGRRLEENFWIFNYDWRQSCQLSGKQLNDFIVNKLERGNALRVQRGLPPWKGVDIINHSMGGIVNRSAMVEHSAPVQRVVYIASPHYGAAKAYFALHPATLNEVLNDFVKDLIPGWYWELIKATPNVLFMEGWLGRVVSSFQSIYELLPDRFYFESKQSLITDDRQLVPQAVTSLEETYFQNPWQLPQVRHNRVRQALQFKEKLGQNLPGKKNLIIYSSSQPTFACAHYDGRLQPKRIKNGDLTVTEASGNPVFARRAHRLMLEGTHSELPNSTPTHEAIRTFFGKA